jgi:hypothetical protein
MSEQDTFFDQIKENAAWGPTMLTANSRVGQSLVICGAGPSLADHWHEIPAADEVWACNSALPYLMDRGVGVTHGFTIHQTRTMFEATEWGDRVFPVHYYLASSVHPELVRHIQAAGRPISMFHSLLGIDNPSDWEGSGSYEMWLYTDAKIFKTSISANYGLNAVPRGICLALAMGFTDIRVYGADCAARPNAPPASAVDDDDYPDWLDRLVFYPDGRTGRVFGDRAVMTEATIDGTRWVTRPDMVMSAWHLVDLAHTYPGITYIGNTLVNAIINKGEAFWDRLPKMLGRGQVGNFGFHGDVDAWNSKASS